METEFQSLTAPPSPAGQRFDQVLAQLLPDHSRARLTRWIKEGFVTLNGAKVRPAQKVYGGEAIVVAAPEESPLPDPAQPLTLTLVHEDEQLIVVDKPAGLVVHPAAGHADGTLLNALLNHDPQLRDLPRAGIVHRLDKDTSGLLVVARTLKAHTHLVRQLQAREMGREYWALVYGRLIAGDCVDEPIGRHPTDRKKMAVRPEGKPAVTHYRIEQRFADLTGLSVRLETGRTHQIRVHLSHRRFPIVGDPVYGGRLRVPAGASDSLRDALSALRRQALHARNLTLVHPASEATMTFTSPLAPDLATLLAVLADDAGQRVD